MNDDEPLDREYARGRDDGYRSGLVVAYTVALTLVTTLRGKPKKVLDGLTALLEAAERRTSQK